MLASIAVDAKGICTSPTRVNNRIQVLDNERKSKAQYQNIGSPAPSAYRRAHTNSCTARYSNDPEDLEHGEIYK